MNIVKALFTTLLLAAPMVSLPALAEQAAAHEQILGDLVLHHAWARATPAGAKSGAAYVEIENKGDQPDRLLGVTSTVATKAALHQMSMENDVMAMQPAGALDIPAHARVALKLHGPHIMLMGLKQPLKEGSTFPMTLTFEKAGSVDLQVVVGKIGAMDSMDVMQ